MLRAIHIKRFGIFKDRTFALGPVTVVAGSNQSGKSTVFDAIRIHAFYPEKRGARNKALYARYGEGTDVTLDWTDGPPEMTDGEFMNLFAVSGGGVWMDLDGDWLAGVKKSLFAGGIDPRALLDAFEKRASDKGSLAHMRDRSKLTRERGETEARLEGLDAEREEILAGLDRQAGQRGELKGVDARLGALAGQEQQVTEEVEFQERIAERMRLREQLTLLDEIAALEEKQHSQGIHAVDRTGELDALEQEHDRCKAVLIRAEEGAETERKRLEALQADAARAEKEREVRQNWPAGVQAVEARMAAYEDGRLTRQLMRGLVAALLLTSGLALLFLSGQEAWGWIAAGAGLAASLAAWTLPGLWDQWRLRRIVKDLWRNRLGGAAGLEPASLVLQSATLDGLRTALAKVAADLERVAGQQENTARVVTEGEKRLATLKSGLEDARRAGQEAAAALRNWMAGMEVESRDQYRDRRNEFVSGRKRLAADQERLEEALRDGNCEDPAQLRAFALERLRELEQGSVPEEGLPEPERRALREKLAELRRNVEGLKQERHALDRTSHGASERLTGRLGNLPGEIAGLGESLRKIGAEIAALDVERRAAGRALELFQEIAADETTVLAELSRDVASTFARLSGLEAAGGIDEATGGAVALAGLRSDEIRALDRQGAARPVEHLSSGAQHLLYLALRLEMARRERRGRFALLSLDEPFAFLDPDRQMETLQYLRGFLEETHWQMILFTNEPAQADRVRAVFPDCTFHDLGEPGNESSKTSAGRKKTRGRK